MPLSKIDSDSLNTPITAVNLAYTGTLTGGTGVVNLGSGQFYKDASGSVGVGTTSMTRFFNLYDTTTNAQTAYFKSTQASGGAGFVAYNNGGEAATFQINGSSNTSYAGANSLNIGSITNNTLAFLTNNTERARIATDGATFFNCTTSPTGNGTGTGGLNALCTAGDAFNMKSTISGNNMINMWSTGNSSNNMILFMKGDGKVSVGNINTTTSSTAFNSTSDYRLKNTVAPMTGALDKVAMLRPVTYKWNVDGSDGEGFIAHELAEVVPSAVTGEKDAVYEDGSIKPQGIDTSFLVATLTAAIQEQQTLITALTARITALETP